jgi:hypothetical protein
MPMILRFSSIPFSSWTMWPLVTWSMITSTPSGLVFSRAAKGGISYEIWLCTSKTDRAVICFIVGSIVMPIIRPMQMTDA